MPDSDDALEIDIDIDGDLRGLFEQAERAAAAPLKPKDVPHVSKGPSDDSLRLLMMGIEALTRAAGENTNILRRMGEEAAKPVTPDPQGDQLLKVSAELRTLADQKAKVTERMFDALHEELRGYKDGFLLESLQRPVIRDLITLYDEVAEIHRQAAGALSEQASVDEPVPGRIVERMQTLKTNLDHNRELILEILARIDVHPIPDGVGKLDKRTQRAVSVEPATDPEEDTVVVRSVKRGFIWKERVVRPEEVVTKKWKDAVSSV